MKNIEKIKTNNISNKPKVVFFGDSITDCGQKGDYLGDGFVAIINKGYNDKYEIINSGISGDRTCCLLTRFDEDLAVHNPQIVFMLIGTNDIWRKFDANDPTSDEVFLKNYTELVKRIKSMQAKLVLMHPFVIDSEDMSEQFKGYLDGFKQELAKKIAIIDSFKTQVQGIIPLNSIFIDIQKSTPANQLALDGIHPTNQGHQIIAMHVKKWL